MPGSKAAGLTARFHTPTQCLGVRLLVSLPGPIPRTQVFGNVVDLLPASYGSCGLSLQVPLNEYEFSGKKLSNVQSQVSSSVCLGESGVSVTLLTLLFPHVVTR